MNTRIDFKRFVLAALIAVGTFLLTAGCFNAAYIQKSENWGIGGFIVLTSGLGYAVTASKGGAVYEEIDEDEDA